MAAEIQVSGGATPEQLAAVLAVLGRGRAASNGGGDADSAYARWRRTRLAAVGLLRSAH